MNKKVKHFINLILAAIGLAMGVAVIVLTTINADISTNDISKMLGFASASFGILALNSISKQE
jgi:hypothetical protein